MKTTYRLATCARADIDDIGFWVAARGSRARAISFTEEFEARCAGLVDFPEAARPWPEYGTGVRAVPFGRFLTLYRWQPSRHTVLVVRVVGATQQARTVS